MSKKLDCRRITSVTQLRRCGYGVGAEVKLKKPYLNPYSKEPMDIGPPVGTRGTVVGAFGTRPTIRWDRPGKYGVGPQVVPPEFLGVIRSSAKPEVIATVDLDKIEEQKGYGLDVDVYDSRICVKKTEPVFDEAGFIVGDAAYELHGTVKGNKAEFTSSRIDMSGVPKSRKYRYMLRQYFESQSPKDIFSGLFD